MILIRAQLFLFVVTCLLSGQASAHGCWESERNPYNWLIYTESEWTSHSQAWSRIQPEEPTLWSLFWAHQTYKQEYQKASTLKNDKRKHCYIGCRIAQATSLEVSIYVGWLKESEDLADCNRKTYFELLDYQSTIEGAQHGAANSDPTECFNYCENYKAPKTRIEL